MNNILKRLYYNNDILKKYYKSFSLLKKNYLQQGGAFSIEYNNTKIKFNKIIDDGIIKLFISSQNDENCISILIDKSKVAYIEGITNNKFNNCFDNPEFNKGFVIMEITIKMLKKYKHKLNIDTIQLKDNSFIYCSDKIKIWLSSLSFLQYNNTFYGRFGFIPKDKHLYKKYLQNQQILSTTLLSNLNLNLIIELFSKKIKYEKEIISYYIKYQNKTIVYWFNKISHKYLLDNCSFFNHLIDYIFKEIKLDKFTHETFILNI